MKNSDRKFTDKRCKQCNKVFTPTRCAQKFCSVVCKDNERARPLTKSCRTCGVTFVTSIGSQVMCDEHKYHGRPQFSKELKAKLLSRQEYRCAICGEEQKDRLLSCDHDHDTGMVRGMLCSTCNHALGLFYDDPALLRMAAIYLELAGSRPKKKWDKPLHIELQPITHEATQGE